MHTGMSFFSRGSHGKGNRGRGNWNRGHRRPRFSIHFHADSQELGRLFQARFFNWIGKGVVQPRPERPPFQAPQVPGIPVPSHVSLQPKVPENYGWKEIFHPRVSKHRGWPNLSLPAPPPNNRIFQAAPVHSPIQSSHASKRLKTKAHDAPDKGKSTPAVTSPATHRPGHATYKRTLGILSLTDTFLNFRMHKRKDFNNMHNSS
jgi:hypothetical protein